MRNHSDGRTQSFGESSVPAPQARCDYGAHDVPRSTLIRSSTYGPICRACLAYASGRAAPLHPDSGEYHHAEH